MMWLNFLKVLMFNTHLILWYNLNMINTTKCQYCEKPNPPSKNNKPRKFCSKKCSNKQYIREQRYYTRKYPDTWGRTNELKDADTEKRRIEFEWYTENMYSIKRIGDQYGIDPSTAWVRAQKWGISGKKIKWRGIKLFYTKEEAEKIGLESPPPQKCSIEQLERSREYRSRPEVRARAVARKALRMKTDPIYRLRYNVSMAVREALKRQCKKKNGESMFEYLPYTPLELYEHIESQFTEHMSWDNYGTYWHMDHIIPQVVLIYDSLKHPNFRKCWALNNLRPLEKFKNASKGSLYKGVRHTYKKTS